jgi:hypothetical protein
MKFQVTLLAARGTDDATAIRALRRGLKYLLRACGLRAISAVELHPETPHEPARGGIRRLPRHDRARAASRAQQEER